MIAYLQRIYRTIGFIIVTGLLLSGASLYVFAEIADEVVEQEAFAQIDTELAIELHNTMVANPTSIRIFEFISLFGFPLLYALGIALAIGLVRRKRWFYLIIWGVALLSGALLNSLIKTFFARPRPSFVDPIALESSFSFPSGHSMSSFIAYGMAAYLICLYTKNVYIRIFAVFGAVLAIVLIGISRLYLGVHYFSDVIGGFAAGAVWLATCITAIRVYRYRAERIERVVSENAQKESGNKSLVAD